MFKGGMGEACFIVGRDYFEHGNYKRAAKFLREARKFQSHAKKAEELLNLVAESGIKG